MTLNLPIQAVKFYRHNGLKTDLRGASYPKLNHQNSEHFAFLPPWQAAPQTVPSPRRIKQPRIILTQRLFLHLAHRIARQGENDVGEENKAVEDNV